VFRAVAVKNGSKASDDESDVRAGSDCEIIEAADQGTIGSAIYPRRKLIRDRDRLIGTDDLDTRDDWGVDRVSVTLAKLMDDAINERSLR
jgi:hypothetical protein